MGPAFYSINRCAVRVPCQFAQMLTHREGDQVVMGINHFGINARVMLHTQGCKWFGRAAGVCFKADLAKRFPAVKAFAWGIEPRNERGRPFGASSKGRFRLLICRRVKQTTMRPSLYLHMTQLGFVVCSICSLGFTLLNWCRILFGEPGDKGKSPLNNLRGST